MTDLTSRVNGLRSFVNENPLGDWEPFGLSRVGFFSAFGMASREKGTQLFRGSINELIDRFVGDGKLLEIHGDSSRYQFRRPAEFDFLGNIVPNALIFQAFSFSTSPFTCF